MKCLMPLAAACLLAAPAAAFENTQCKDFLIGNWVSEVSRETGKRIEVIDFDARTFEYTLTIVQPDGTSKLSEKDVGTWRVEPGTNPYACMLYTWPVSSDGKEKERANSVQVVDDDTIRLDTGSNLYKRQ